MVSSQISQLKLYNFRNYSDFSQNFQGKSIVIIGPNGSGKTNILESISLFSSGKGLRGTNLSQLINHNYPEDHWRIHLLLSQSEQLHDIKIWSSNNEEQKMQKNIIFDACKMNNFTELLEYLNIIWLTPQMDQLMTGPASERRKFFDRIVASFYPDHIKHLASYEKMLRERSYILKISYNETVWLNSIEEKIVEYGVIIAASRVEVAHYLEKMVEISDDKFPHALIRLENDIEKMIESKTSIEVENYFLNILKANRENDLNSGRTNAGIHRTDLVLYHKEKNMNSCYCSTGEQKSLLINLILAQAKGLIARRSLAPILLLDEIVAHLDNVRRRELFLRIENLNIQTWMTGTEENSFVDLKNDGSFYFLKENSLKEIEKI